MKRTFLFAVLFAATVAFAGSKAEPLPSESLYHWTAPLEDHTGRKTRLDVFRGKPVIVTMFYSSCTWACPIIISNIRRLEKELSPTAQAQVRVVLISMDPERDTPEAMTKILEQHGADPLRWRLVRPVHKDDVREAAALLGMTYERKPDGSYNHSAEITLLDPNGVQAARLESPGDDNSVMKQKIEAMAKKSADSKLVR